MVQLLQKLKRDFSQSQTIKMDTHFSIYLGGRYTVLCCFSVLLSTPCLNIVHVIYTYLICRKPELAMISLPCKLAGSSYWRSRHGIQRCYWAIRKCQCEYDTNQQTGHSRLWVPTRGLPWILYYHHIQIIRKWVLAFQVYCYR